MLAQQVVVGFPSRSVDWLVVASWLGFQYQAWSPSWCKYNQRSFGDFQGMGTSTVILARSCHAGHCCGSEVPQLHRTIVCSPPLAACTLHFGTIKTSPQGEGFQIRFSSGPLDSVSKVHGVFSDGDLPSASRMRPRATAGTYNILSLLNSPDQQFIRGLLMPG